MNPKFRITVPACRPFGEGRPARLRGCGWLAAVAVVLVFLTGCAGNSMVLKGQVDKYQQQQVNLSRQRDELQTRASSMDRDNQELGTLLAQARQKSTLLEDQVRVLREQLDNNNAQVTRLRDEKKASEQKVQTLTASLQRQGGVTITPNNSLLQTLPTINQPDVNVRRDGDVVRVELPCHRMFESGNAKLLPGAAELIAASANEVLRLYPNQVLGVEGHTDSDPLPAGQWRNAHQLSLGRAMAVYDVLTTQVRVPASQLLLVGHGSNHPIFSNATPAGKQRNNRVELVIYPDMVNRQ